MAGVTLREIARKSGVSYQTVSRILNHQSNLHKPDTVARVRKVAEELGYRPNLNARGIQTGKTRMIGIMNGFGQGPLDENLLLGMHDALIQLDYLPIMLMTRPGVCTSLEQVHRLVDRRVEGIVLRPASQDIADDCLREIADRKIPLVMVEFEADGAEFADFAGADDIKGGELAAEHLLRLGHSRVAYISWLMQTEQKQERLKGFQDAFHEAGDTQLTIADIPFDLHTLGEPFVRELLSRPDRPTAVFVSTDDLAKGVYAAARDLRLRIPQDLSVVGFSDLGFAAEMQPALTTLRHDPLEIGEQAVRLLLDRIEGKVIDPRPRKVRLAPELIIRESTAPPYMIH
ncbi:LacI family DNA-binding transcriptional regulator [Candidatus Sumerlaeota bacterium]|nr:LacI family DNA-binding transcriptional regulator [Candidatus Sumerlaeota bacterium]